MCDVFRPPRPLSAVDEIGDVVVVGVVAVVGAGAGAGAAAGGQGKGCSSNGAALEHGSSGDLLHC